MSASAFFDSQSISVRMQLEEAFSKKLDFDFDGLIPERINTNLYAALADKHDCFESLNKNMTQSIERAFLTAAAELKATYPDMKQDISLDNQVELSWQALAALYKVYRNGLSGVLRAALNVNVYSDGTAYTLLVSLPMFDEIADISEQDSWFVARFSFFYLNTYYDESAEKRDTAYRPLKLGYVSGLALPVEERFEMGIKEGWYKPRSGGRRRHMGTDIKGSARSDLYSCTDGTVVCTGYDKTAGNYVCIMDPNGYEYQYFHMYEISTLVSRGDRVKAGQLIGRMGNTGNSVANHLHLAIVNPNGCHIDPYMVLTQAGYGRNQLLFDKEVPVVFKDEIEILVTPT